jgi:hypothetical protein
LSHSGIVVSSRGSVNLHGAPGVRDDAELRDIRAGARRRRDHQQRRNRVHHLIHPGVLEIDPPFPDSMAMPLAASITEPPPIATSTSHPDSAYRWYRSGLTAISVSNHGGNNLGSTPATIRALPAIVDAVGGEIENVLDGGCPRGSDVVRRSPWGLVR